MRTAMNSYTIKYRSRLPRGQNRLGIKQRPGFFGYKHRGRQYVTDNKAFHVFSWAPDFNGLKQQEDDERLFINEIADTHNFELHYHNRSIEQFKKDLDAIVPVECNIMFPILNTARKARRYNCDLLLSGWGGTKESVLGQTWHFFLKHQG